MSHRLLRPALALGLFSFSLWACSSSDSAAPSSGDPGASGHDAGGGGSAADASGGGSGGSSGSSSGGSGGDPTMRLVGRFDTSDSKGPRFGWPGSSIHTRFEGTSIAMSLKDTGGDVFGISIDGVDQPKVTVTASTANYPLAAGLAAGTHSLVLTKLTESNVGTAQLLGFQLDTGKALDPTPEPAPHRIEVLGDSISCGYGVDGADQTCTFSPGTENVGRTYIALTAAALNAEFVDVAYSGKGIYREYGGATTNQMPTLWNRTIADDASSTWNFSRYTPDVLVILLGANDFHTGDPGQAFTDAYGGFVKAARAKYPNATIVCTLSPMLADAPGQPYRTSASGYINSVVTAANTAGDKKVLYFEFDVQQGTDGYGCDWHPSATTHQKMATKLTATLKTALGW
jgi:lysophospholipase L1-like esterase